jgi:hypothetical protein
MPADTLIVPVDSLEAGLVTQAPTSGEKSVSEHLIFLIKTLFSGL